MPYELQRPGTSVPYSCDFGVYLDGAGSPSDTILTASWSITPVSDGSPTEPTLHTQSIDGTNRIATTFVRNPERGEVYALIAQINTAQGLTDRRTITIRGGP